MSVIVTSPSDSHEGIKFDLRLPADLVITSFPERWDCTKERDTLLKSIRKRVEHLDVDIDIQPNRLITEILQACAEFQPTLTVRKQRFTWTEAFEDEILSLVSVINPYPIFNHDSLCWLK